MALQNSQDRFNGVIASLAIKAPCKTVSDGDGNILLEGEQTVGGIAVVGGDRVLVMEQTDPIENGIYCVDTSAWQRTADWDGNRDVAKGTLVTVNRPPNNLTCYVQLNLGVGQDMPVIDQDPVNFSIFFTQTSSLDDLDDVDLTGCSDDDLMHFVGGVLVCTLGELTFNGVTLFANGNIQNAHAQIRDVAPNNTTPTLNPKVGEIWTGWGGAAGSLTGILEDGGAGIRALLMDLPASGHTTRRWNREQITASTTQTQGNGQLTSTLVDVNVVANANDTVTLIDPQSSLDHIVMNRGANTLQIFPAAGHDLGQGTNQPMVVAAGGTAVFVGVTTTRWHLVLVSTGAGGVGGLLGPLRGCKVWKSAAIDWPRNDLPFFGDPDNPPGETMIVVGFDNEVYDTDNIHDNSTNNSRFTIPAGITQVEMNVGYMLDSLGAPQAGIGHVIMRKNNVVGGVVDTVQTGWIPWASSDESAGSNQSGGATGEVGQNSFYTGTINITDSDYLELFILAQGGEHQTPANGFWAEMRLIQ